MKWKVHDKHHSGNGTFRAYRDDRGWFNIENAKTRNLTIVHDEEWDDFVQIVLMLDKAKKEGKL